MMATVIKQEPFAWSRRRFWWTIVAVFLGHVAVVMLLGERPHPARTETSPQVFSRLVTSEIRGADLDRTFLVVDPTLVVLPSRHGFSGPAWLSPGMSDYQPPDWDEPPRWLQLQASMLGKTADALVAKTRFQDLGIVKQRPPVVTEHFPTSSPIAQKPSSLTITGDLAMRKLVSTPKLPFWRHFEPVSDSVVELAVNAIGEVVSCRLAASTAEPGSLAMANRKALDISRSLCFQPLNSATNGQALTWGTISFAWQTLPEAVTNKITSISPSR